MTIKAPINDHQCLGAITDRVIAMLDDPMVVELARQFPDTDSLVEWLRGLDQKDDTGDPCDGPKVNECDPAQRFRIFTDTPNCLERTGIYTLFAEIIDPTRERQMVTVDTDAGRHTLPVEDGEPVILDPKYTRNGLRAAVFRAATRNGADRVRLSPEQATDWIACIASEPARRFVHGEARVRAGHRALRRVLKGQSIREHELRDVVFVLALAEREARPFGRQGVAIVEATARAIDQLDLAAGARAGCVGHRHRNAGVELRLGKVAIRPDLRVLSALARVGGRLGYQAGVAALREKIATLGVAAPVLGAVEHELNREGMSLGPLAKPPPMKGTIAAVTPQAIAGRWLARKL